MQPARLSPLTIQDPLLRTQFYKALRSPLPDWQRHEVALDEVLMPELISLRFYGTPQLKKIVVIIAQLDDMRGALKAGTTLQLPPIKWIRQQIKVYADREGKK
ncbi:hypothetical protein [Spartinivicinus ruber]|uniref:hypothetical protein n=1 Tax=Spartinivicinus ruber TaxID=2683272 RepID=UPI0013D2EF2D|nr:hypothetical protein [Spartinivicinus ruber]